MIMPNFLIIGAAKAGTTALQEYLQQHPNPLKTWLKPLLLSKIRPKIQHHNLTTPQIDPEVRQDLIDLYREDILQCQDLIDRDLSPWLVGSAS